MPNEIEDESLGVEQLPQDEMEATPTESNEPSPVEADTQDVETTSEDSTLSSAG